MLEVIRGAVKDSSAASGRSSLLAAGYGRLGEMAAASQAAPRGASQPDTAQAAAAAALASSSSGSPVAYANFAPGASQAVVPMYVPGSSLQDLLLRFTDQPVDLTAGDSGTAGGLSSLPGVTAIPEPSTSLLLFGGFFTLALAGRARLRL